MAIRNMAACLALIMICCVGLCKNAFATDGSIMWQYRDTLPGAQQSKASATDSLGNVIVTGYQRLTVAGNDDYWTAKFKADGTGVAWRAVYNMSGGDDQASAVVVDGKDNVIVTGYAWNGTNRDIHTIKYCGADGSLFCNGKNGGEVIWEHTFNGAANGNDIATAIGVDSQNNIYVGGSSQNASGTDDYIILKYAASGPVANIPAWQVLYNGSANGMDNLYGLAVGTNAIAVTGQSYNGTTSDMLTVKYDLSGTKQWERRYSSVNGAMGKKVRFDPGGNVIVTGLAADAVSKNIYTVKYDGNGNKSWDQNKTTIFDEEPNDLFVDSSGEVFITGYSHNDSGTNKRAYTARYNGSTGVLAWESSSNMGGDSDEGLAIVGNGTGDVFITGYTVSAGDYDFMTIKYQRDSGAELWNHRFSANANLSDQPIGIGLSPTGDVLVAGWSDSDPNNSYDYTVLKLDQQLVSAPSNLATTTLSSNSIHLTWTDNSVNEDGFKIARKLGQSGDYVEIFETAPGVTTYDNIGLNANATYYYRVRAFKAASVGNPLYSLYSNEAHGLTVYFTSISPASKYTYNSSDNLDDYITAIAMGPDNNPVVTGYTQRNTGDYNYLTIKLDRSGSSLKVADNWPWEYDDPDGGTDRAICVAVDSANNTIVSGYAHLNNPVTHSNMYSIYTEMYPSYGPPEAWKDQYNGPGNIDDRPVAISTATDSANNTAVVGYGINAANNADIYVIMYNSTNGRVWASGKDGLIPGAAPPYDGPGHGNDVPSAAVFGQEGSLYVTGYSEKSFLSGNYSFFTAKYSSANGALIWSKVYSALTSGDSRGTSIAVDSQGGVYVTGSATNAAGNRDIYTIKYCGTPGSVACGAKNSGDIIWERSFNGAANGNDSGVTVRVDSYDGSIVVAGTSLTSAGNNDFTLIKYTSAGDTVWQTTILRPNNNDTLVGMGIDPSGTIYLTGNSSNGASSVDIFSVIVDASGTVLATSLYDGTGVGYKEASGIVANEKGEAFAGGYATNASGNADYLVLEFKSTNFVTPMPTHATVTPQTDSSKLAITWSNNYATAAYHIERTSGPVTVNSNWAVVSTTGANTASYTDINLSPNTNYCYRIEAFVSSAVSRKTSYICATTTPAQPVLTLSNISLYAVDLGWVNVAGNTGYKVEQSIDNSTWSQIGSSLATDTVTYHDSGLSPGTAYYYRVSAFSPSGPTLPSAVKTVQFPPTLSQSAASATASQLVLNWTPISGVTGYKLERSSDGTTWSGTPIATPAQPTASYTDTNLTAGTTYYYRIKAVTASGDSIPSAVMPFTTTPAIPTLNTVTAVTSNQINLSWLSAAGATGYTVWESQCNWLSAVYTPNGSGGYNYIAPAPANCDSYPTYTYYGSTVSLWSTPTQVTTITGQGNTSYNRTGLAGNTYNRYYVVATTANSTSAASSTLKAWTPVAQATLTATPTSDTSVSLSWTGVNSCTAYKVEASPVNLSSWATISNPTYYMSSCTGSFTHNTGVTASTLYNYKVTVYGVVSPSGVTSAVQSATTFPGGPAVTSLTLGSNQVTVNWTNVTGNTGYNVQRLTATDGNNPPTGWYGNTVVSSTIPQGTTTFVDNFTTQAGYAYKYQVQAKVSGGTTGYGSDGGKWVRTAPSTPSYIYTNGASSNFSVNWGYTPGTISYTLQYMTPSGSDCSAGTAWTTVSPSPTSSSYTSALSTTSSWCFKVSSHNEAGDSTYSGSAIYVRPPTAASFTLGTPTVSQIPLNWSNVPGNNGYKIEGNWPNNTTCYGYPNYIPCAGWLTVANTAKDATTLTLSGLLSNTTYQYRISTNYLNGGYGGTSPPILSTPGSKSTTALSAMTLNSLTVNSYSQITVSWPNVAGNNGYVIQRSLDGISNWITIVTAVQDATSYGDSGLSGGTTYYYQGFARDGGGVLTAVSNKVNATTPLSVPVLLSANASSDSRIDLSWQLVPVATNYYIYRSTDNGATWSSYIANPAINYSLLYCGTCTIPTTDCQTPIAAYASYSDTGLHEGTNYCYQIKSNKAALYSLPSTTMCATTNSLAGPTMTTVAVATAPQKKIINIVWDYSGSVCTPVCGPPDGYELWRQAWNGEWILIHSGSDKTFSDKINIESQKLYNYKVRAYKGSNTSVFSSAKGVTTPAFSLTDSTCQ